VCTTCSIGFKGSEDLGNGLKAIFKLDFQFDMNDVGGIGDRDQWLGMAGRFGSIKVGTISTTYKSTGAMLDPIYRTVGQQRDMGMQSGLHSGAGSSGEGRAENTVRYDTPSWNGLKLAGTYTITPEDQNDNDNGYSGGLSYENGGILVFGNWITNDSGGDNRAWKVGGKYTLANLSMFGQFEKDGGLITDRRRGTLGAKNSGKGDEANVWMLGGTFTLGNNMLYGGYGSGEGLDGNAPAKGQPRFGNDDYKSWEVIGVHNMSKRTFLYGGYIRVDPDEEGVDDTKNWTAGMRHKF